MLKAILFDMDGVLVDAKEWHYFALNRILEKFGMAINRDAHLSTYDGLPTKTKLNMLSQTKRLPRKLHGFLNEMKQRYTEEIIVQKCRPVFHIQWTVSSLRRQGYKIGVCSNSIRETVVNIMRYSALTDYLDIILSNEDVAKPKPDPEIYVKAMQVLNVNSDETLIVEDNHHGIQAAKASGAYVYEVADPSVVTLQNITNKIMEVTLCKF